MTTIDYVRLRELATSTVPFIRYHIDDPNPCFIVGSEPADDDAQIVISDVFDESVARYLSAFNPETAKALLDEIERLRGEGGWEYGHRYSRMDGSTYLRPVDQETFESRPPTAYRADGTPYWNYESVRRRKAGPWERVEGEGDGHDQG